ncbi:MAG TPA: hypothetical protein VFZ34_02750 [Blastocatellia bacterium]|nr:hypothetical protein [Blastocatellia bacterium]
MQQATVRWEWIGEGWNMFTQRWGMWVVHMLIFALVLIAILAPIYIIAIVSSIGASASDTPEAPPAIFFVAMLLLYPLMLVAISFLLGGTYKTAMKQLRGEPTSVGDLFSGADCFLRVLGTLILIVIMAMIGAIFCIIPGLIVQGLCFFAIPLVVERRMGPVQAIQASIEATKKDWLMFTVFAFVVGLIAGIGAVLCYVGALVSYPLMFTITSVAYRDVFGVAGASSPQSYAPPPPPDYGMNPPPPSSWQ